MKRTLLILVLAFAILCNAGTYSLGSTSVKVTPPSGAEVIEIDEDTLMIKDFVGGLWIMGPYDAYDGSIYYGEGDKPLLRLMLLEDIESRHKDIIDDYPIRFLINANYSGVNVETTYAAIEYFANIGYGISKVSIEAIYLCEGKCYWSNATLFVNDETSIYELDAFQKAARDLLKNVSIQSKRMQFHDSLYSLFGADANLYYGGCMGGQIFYPDPPPDHGEYIGSIPSRTIVNVLYTTEEDTKENVPERPLNENKMAPSLRIHQTTAEEAEEDAHEWLLIETASKEIGWIENYHNPRGGPGYGGPVLFPIDEWDWSNWEYYYDALESYLP